MRKQRDRGSNGRHALRRVLTLAVLLYVAFDLTDPLLPGAFNFDPDTSVEVIATRAPRLGMATGPVVRPLDRATSPMPDHGVVTTRPGLAPAPRPARPLPHAHLRAPASDSGSPTEDH